MCGTCSEYSRITNLEDDVSDLRYKLDRATEKLDEAHLIINALLGVLHKSTCGDDREAILNIVVPRYVEDTDKPRTFPLPLKRFLANIIKFRPAPFKHTEHITVLEAFSPGYHCDIPMDAVERDFTTFMSKEDI